MKIERFDGVGEKSGKLIHYVRFTPKKKRNFLANIRRFLKYGNLRLLNFTNSYEIISFKRKHHYNTGLNYAIKKVPHKIVLIIFTWGDESGKRKFKTSRGFERSLEYTSTIYYPTKAHPKTASNLNRFATVELLTNYYTHMVHITKDSDVLPLVAITFKFI